jgi:hypothetical protein
VGGGGHRGAFACAASARLEAAVSRRLPHARSCGTAYLGRHRAEGIKVQSLPVRVVWMKCADAITMPGFDDGVEFKMYNL